MRYFSFIVFSLLFHRVIAQQGDSLQVVKFKAHTVFIDTMPTSFYLSAGTINVYDKNAKFLNNLLNMFTTDGATVSHLDHSTNNTSLVISGGAEFTGHHLLWTHHILEAGYFHSKGSYTLDRNYNFTNASVSDKVNGTYVTDAFHLSYKFEPGGRRFFGSLGLNLIFGDAVVKETIEETRYDNTSNSLKNENHDQKHWVHFVNCPLSLGGGIILRSNRFICKPGFYFMPCFNGPTYFMATVRIGLRYYQLESY